MRNQGLTIIQMKYFEGQQGNKAVLKEKFAANNLTSRISNHHLRALAYYNNSDGEIIDLGCCNNVKKIFKTPFTAYDSK